MKLTKRQKSASIAAAVCVGLLVLDRLFLAPSDASASATPPDPSVAAATVRDPLDHEMPMDAEPTPRAVLATRLDTIRVERQIDPTTVRNAFEAPLDWLPAQDPGVVEVPDTHADARVAEFKRKHRLNAVMANDRRGYAVIDGRGLRLGQTLDGFKLVEVRERSVILETKGATVELSLPNR